LAKEFALCAAVAFAEWVNGIDLAEIVSGSRGEAINGKPAKMRLGLQLRERAFEARRDVLMEGERVAGFRDVDGAELPGPGEDVLENVAMDRLEMRGIEGAGNWLRFQLAQATGCGVCLELAQQPEVLDVAKIPKNAGTGAV
jgi:hypothetical protein